MKIAVDTSGMRITHAHPDTDTLHGIVYLEGGALKHVTFDNTANPYFLIWLTTADLGKLYANLAGVPAPPVDSYELRQMLAVLCDTITPRDINAAELEAQIESAGDKLDKTTAQFRYQRGGRVPHEGGDLFPVRVTPSAGTPAHAAQRALQRERAPAATPAATPTAPSAPRTPAPRAARGSTGSRGSVKATVWATAERMWSERGQPATKDAFVQELRKDVLAALLEQGVHRVTAGLTLGRWVEEKFA